MNFASYFPIWNKLNEQEQALLKNSVYEKNIEAGTLVKSGGDCLGLMLVKSGQLRAYVQSDDGKEVTLYRLLSRDMCLFSASCMMKNIQFDVSISAEKDTSVWVIPLDVYENLMKNSAIVANYTNELMSARFTDVMWLIEQIMWKSFDKRLAEFLVEESAVEESDELNITHEQIARHLGTAREVVTRMLKYFQMEGMVTLERGVVKIISRDKLLKV
ncbi:MAG: Crp/Fnr family transcriptional regulator [Clostridia bacterium]|nr:Crp/Fnr family transcriptional regulator [Clostridia bacterium]MDY5264062.1 Crp/Fnr family transcriptional regulator [Eubacteriales bacterium]